MKNWTVLRILSTLIITISVLYTVINYKPLAAGEGWGVVEMIWFVVAGLIGLAIDEIFKMIIRDRRWVNIYEAVLLVVFIGLLTWSALYRSL